MAPRDFSSKQDTEQQLSPPRKKICLHPKEQRFSPVKRICIKQMAMDDLRDGQKVKTVCRITNVFTRDSRNDDDSERGEWIIKDEANSSSEEEVTPKSVKRAHTGERRNNCGKGFTRKPNLNQHEEDEDTSKSKSSRYQFAHTGERRNNCGKGFTRKSNLNQQRRVDYADVFPCPICDKTFLNLTDRLCHVMTQECTRGNRHLHLIANVWHCLTCDDKHFVNRKEADLHARRHELGKEVHCLMCNRVFQGKNAKDIVPHVKKQHREYVQSLLV